MQHICCKARKVLGIIYFSNTSNTDDSLAILCLYSALVRPHLEYAAKVWNPHLDKDFRLVKKVQKFAIRICWIINTITSRQKVIFIFVYFYCILNGLVYFQTESVLPLTMSFPNCRHFNPDAYRLPLAHDNGLKFSFLINAIKVWNNLPLEAINSQCLVMFKHYNNIITSLSLFLILYRVRFLY